MMTREYGKGYDEGYADGLKDATQSLAQPEQEPVAWYDKDGVITANPIEFSQPLYTTPPQPKEPEQEPVAFKCGDATVYIKPPVYGTPPPQRTWVGLTDEQMQFLATAIGQAKQIIDTYNTEFVTARDDLRRCSELLAAHNIKE